MRVGFHVKFLLLSVFFTKISSRGHFLAKSCNQKLYENNFSGSGDRRTRTVEGNRHIVRRVCLAANSAY